MMNRYQKKIKSKNKYREFIKILNGILKLTERQIDILIAIMVIADEMPQSEFEEKGIINTRVRRKIIKEERIFKTNLSQFIKHFRESGILVRLEGDERLYMNPLFVPVEDNGRITVEFMLQLED